jgi:hypothetical protein
LSATCIDIPFPINTSLDFPLGIVAARFRAAEQSPFPTTNNYCWLECVDKPAIVSRTKSYGININVRRVIRVYPSELVRSLRAMGI